MYIDGLNGIRAIAAIGVVIAHITSHLSSFNLNPYILGVSADGSPQVYIVGGQGVSMFFALSGFLITYLLLLEKKEQHKINIRFFYMRRILRIWPLYYLFIILCAVAIHFSGEKITPTAWLFYIFYAPNIPYMVNACIPVLQHYWSLGVEEQFYLFWPWIIAKIKRRLEWYILIYIVVIMVLKIGVRYGVPGHDESFLYKLLNLTRFHCMAIGGLGAILYSKNNAVLLRICNNKITQLLAWLVVFALVINKFHIASVIDTELVSLVTLVIIIGQATKVNRLINLQTKVPDFLGKISYGIYVYHPLIIWGYSYLFANIGLSGFAKYVFVYGITILTTILVAYCSYNYFEKWFLKRKINYSIINSSRL